jgi:hypothetical protein
MRISFFVAAFTVGILNGTPVVAETKSFLTGVPKSFVKQQPHLLVPRGGAVAKTNAVAKSNPEAAAVQKKSHLEFDIPALLKHPRFPWFVCTVLSGRYFLLFVKNGGIPTVPSEFLKDGFCVTGLKGSMPIEGKRCSASLGNSHQFAWGIDVLYTIIALVLPYTKLCYTKQRLPLILNSLVFALIIVGHGVLHAAISSASCGKGGNLPGPYSAYIAILMAVDVFGFSSIPSMPDGFKKSLALIAALTALTLQLTTTSVSGFFMISGLVVSVTGFVAPNPKTVTPQLGWSFIPACIVCLLEFVKCDSILVQYGGHAYYDFFLHLAMIVSLLFGDFSFGKAKK